MNDMIPFEHIMNINMNDIIPFEYIMNINVILMNIMNNLNNIIAF
jgi:hypothetical protein|eukprot:COSAG06_NODE_6240_length_3020_cov_20.570055_3_plen_45_part_00